MTAATLVTKQPFVAHARPFLVGLTIVLSAMAGVLIVTDILPQYIARPESFGGDITLYLERTRSVLAGNGFYLDRQLHGTYEVAVGDSLYPPTAILLFAPFLVLPIILWWLIPAAVIGYVFYRRTPAMWTWPLIAAAFLFPRTSMLWLYGNPAIWTAAFLAAGTVWRWPSVLVLLKPSLFPFALVGIRSRAWWIAAAVFAAVSLLFLPLWFQYVQVVTGARQFLYSIIDVPLMLVALAPLSRNAVPPHRYVKVVLRRERAFLPDELQA